MRISTIDFLTCDAGWRPWLFVKITTDTGLVGYSEVTDSHGSPRGIAGVLKDLQKILLGQDPEAYEKLYWEMYSATRQSPGSIVQKAIGGIENALLDIVAKLHGVPVYRLFGGPIREKLPIYWSHWGTTRVRAADHVGVKPIQSISDIKKLVKETKARGIRAIKTNVVLFDDYDLPKVYMPGFGKSESSPSLALELLVLNNIVKYIAAIRKTGGQDFGIILDLNFNFKPEGYVRIARALEPYNLMWLEIDCYDAAALSEIRRVSPIPICSGENLYTLRQFKPYFENRAVDILSVDLLWNGFWQSKKIADTAEAYELNITPHNYYSHLATFIAANFAAVIPNFQILELDIDDVPWKDSIVSHVPVVENGHLILPTRSGWGADLNEEELKLHAVRPT